VGFFFAHATKKDGDMMKTVFVILAALLLVGCMATPEQVAAGDAIRMQANEAAADRELLRTMANQYANQPPPAPVIIQTPPPNYTVVIILTVLAGVFLATLVIVLLTFRNQHPPQTATQPRVILLSTGRGQYQIIDQHGTRPLVWSNPQDVRLLDEVER
jgi:hypothetical protein